MAKILIVDDSEFARARLIKLFEEGGHEVVGSADCGEKALSLYKSLHPELVTMDYVMEEQSGEEAMKGIIKYDPNARVIIISGSNDNTLREKMVESGAKAFVEKFDFHKNVLQVIKQVMSS
jgi:two-component system chemotaxis response regulator CheY